MTKIPEQPVLIDDDSDESTEAYSPSPVAPVVINKEEPTDLFARLAAQMEEEKKDQFSLAKHDVMPGEEVFTPVGNVRSDASAATASSTPILREDDSVRDPVFPKSTAAATKKSKPAQPSIDVLNMLLASDEPEYNVDETIPDIQVDSAADEKYSSTAMSEGNPFEDKKEALTAAHKQENMNPFESPPVESTNPFAEEPSSTSQLNPFEEDAATDVVSSNPFESESTAGNPFEEPSDTAPANTNPFEEVNSSTNPFGEEPDDAAMATIKSPETFQRTGSSRFAGHSRQKKKDKKSAPAPPKPQRAPQSSSESSALAGSVSSQAEVTTPVAGGDSEKSATPLVSVDISASPVLKSASKSARSGSNSRETESPKTRYKKEKKAPKAPTVDGGEALTKARAASTHTYGNSPFVESPKQRSSSHTGRVDQVVYDIASLHPKVSLYSCSLLLLLIGVVIFGVIVKIIVISAALFTPSIAVSVPFSPTECVSSLVWPIVTADWSILQPDTKSQSERQPAIGAEAPEKPAERVSTADIGVQTTPQDNHDPAPSEFRNKSKQVRPGYQTSSRRDLSLGVT